ncbi:transcriptional regulator containing an amidase domain and an AraC-type DNA-binding HTH domain [Opitutaceae bacterium TAV1]|nr:transcriptional regulator containing an amidase domain and an AraC-type DNA-binding HTH domain [Opitutaceae bacterium TAV1]
MNLTSPLSPRKTIRQDSVQLSHRRPVRIHPFSNHGDYPLHDHEFYEICLILRGRAEHLSDDGVCPLRRGSVVIMPPGRVHGLRKPAGLNGVNIYYLAPWLLGDPMLLRQRPLALLFLGKTLFPAGTVRTPILFEVSSPALTRLERMMEEITAEYAHPFASLFSVRLLFLRFLHELSREYEIRHGGSGIPFHEEVWAAILLIEQCVQQNRRFRVSDLARQIGCSAGHLHRLFCGATGAGPMEYFQARRMQHAARLVLDPELNLTEVAYQVGCADSAHFSRCFRRHMGMTPRDYKRNFRTGE